MLLGDHITKGLLQSIDYILSISVVIGFVQLLKTQKSSVRVQ